MEVSMERGYFHALVVNSTLIDWIAIVLYVVLLVASIWMLVSFYVCDSGQCKAYQQAAKEGTPGSKEYILALLHETFNDGIWPLAFIGSTLMVWFFFWFTGLPIVVREYMLVFIMGFIVIYFMFSFFGHHYLRPIGEEVSKYIDELPPVEANDAEEIPV